MGARYTARYRALRARISLNGGFSPFIEMYIAPGLNAASRTTSSPRESLTPHPFARSIGAARSMRPVASAAACVSQSVNCTVVTWSR